MQDNTVKAVYIHIPFCKNICSYCDFCKNFYNDLIASKYLDALKKEIQKYYKGNKISTLYIGGGTPSCLSKDNLTKLFEIIKIFNCKSNVEFTFECNYEDITDNLMKILKDNGVNRLSIGIQTFNNKFEKLLERKINKRSMIRKINISKKYFNNINLDLMYGFYNETTSNLKSDLKTFLKFNISHISTYSLIVENHTKLKIKDIKELDDSKESAMYYMIIDILKKHGYYHYEISNFSKKDYESKHNLTYWNNDSYYGFGAGASGFIDGIRYDNTKNINNYIKCNYKINEEKVDYDQLLMDEVMLNLRKTLGINKLAFKNKSSKEIEQLFKIEDLIKEKLIIDNGKNLFIPENKLFISNYIISLFQERYIYLENN